MKGIKEAHDSLESWFNKGCVGYLIFFHPPGSKIVDCFSEQVIKLREMDNDMKALVEALFGVFPFDKAEFFCDKDGRPDRVKVTRSVR